MIKKIKNYFKKPQTEIDVTDMIREQLKGVTLDFYDHNNTIENNLTENEKKQLYADAEMIKTNKSFQKIIKHLIDVQGNYTVKEARTMGDVAFGRATINGISLFEEEIERLSNIYREINKPEEEFDKYSLIAED